MLFVHDCFRPARAGRAAPLELRESVPGRVERQAKRLWRSHAGGAPNSEQFQIRNRGHKSLIATKARRIKRLARHRTKTRQLAPVCRKVADKPGNSGFGVDFSLGVALLNSTLR